MNSACQPKLQRRLVEAVGIEPTSEEPTEEISTSLAFLFCPEDELPKRFAAQERQKAGFPD